jgi:glycosyltransferase involved in cell wall biosynthesis
VQSHREFPPQLAALRQSGAKITRRMRWPFGRKVTRWLNKKQVAMQPGRVWLRRTRPDFVVISAAGHVDDVSVAHSCRALGIPHAILVQAAGCYQWTDGRYLDSQRTAYAQARQCFFVSNENRRLMEANLAIDFSNARIIDNPFAVPADVQVAWPLPDPGWKLACVGRLDFSAKGQDILMEVLRQPRWRARPLHLTFYGNDAGNRRQIEELIKLYGLETQIRLGGYLSNVADIWQTHQALVLPSRYEGNPLSLIEAMLCRRMAIVSNVGRAAELVDHGRSGFVMPAATVELLDATLEEAWQCRERWQAMGEAAGDAIRTRHSLHPAADFADAILNAAGFGAQLVPRDAQANVASAA